MLGKCLETWLLGFVYCGCPTAYGIDCLGALCQWAGDGVRGNGNRPNCFIRSIAPMLSVVQAQGAKEAGYQQNL